ncbi:phospholipase D family protein [Mesorhizobium sp. M0809]|uniref:phospholipase D family protein n=1 Tax=Mesorhizobium sp. M0809 TaxID=2957003 RepID=UPI00333A4957
MASALPTHLAVAQITGGAVYLSDHLNKLLVMPGLKRFRAAVSYARWSGLGLLATNIEAFLKKGGEFQTIYGIGNGITTPDSLLYSLYLKEQYSTHTYAGSVEDKYQNATFHSKFFEFQFKDTTVALVGSANLTGGGLLANTELGVQVHFSQKDALAKQLDDAWKDILAHSEPVTLARIRKLKQENDLGSELENENNNPKAAGKPFLAVAKKTATKPLYLKILNVPKKATKAVLLPKLDPLTQKPKKLYLQILLYETGAQAAGGHAGYQIQLPVATLAAFFGVAPNQSQVVSFHFGPEVITVHLTHFGNNTHRVRLKPLRDIKRPAIVVFERIGPNEYDCSVVPGGQYKKVLAEKCVEQTRAGARKWGLS